MEVAPGDEEVLRRRRDEGVRVVAERLPRGEVEDRVAAVDAEAVDHAVVVGHEARTARRVDRDRAAEGMEVPEDVVPDGVAGRAVGDVHAPAAVARGHDRVVDDEIARRARRRRRSGRG
jgi:hypothetical protein